MSICLKIICVIGVICGLTSRCLAQTARPVSYKKQIAPIFATSCNACHGGAMPQSGLSTTSYAALMKGGTRGRAVLAANPKDSLLVQYLEGTKQPRMPIGSTLKPAEIALVKRWIAEGAKSDGEAQPVKPKDAPTTGVRSGILPQIASLAWKADGSLLAAGTYREVIVFDAAGKRLRTLTGLSDVVRALAFSPDGNVLAAAGGVPGQGGEIRFWDANTGMLLKTVQGHTDCIYGFAWRPDGKQFVTTSYDKTIRLWDAEKYTMTAELKEHAEAVYAAAYSSNGKFLATSSADRSIRVWDAATGNRLYTLAGHTDVVTSLSFDPTAAAGERLLSASADKTVRLWTMKPDNGESAKTYAAQDDVITDMHYSPDGKWFVTASNDGAVKLWDAAKGESLKTIVRGGDAILAVAFTPNNKTLAVGSYDGSVTLYTLPDGAKSATLIAAPKRTAQQK